MKHALIVYVGGLWATVDTLNSLRYGDAELISDDEKILGRINALIGAGTDRPCRTSLRGACERA